ncbi:MAG: gamma-glutamyl kinase, partial [Methanobacteriota archaeon]
NFSDRKSLANLWGCISKLFYLGAIPIINENDVISSDQLQHSTTFGDNDVLASMAAKSLIVGSILFLSDVDGLLDANGNLISYVEGATSFSEVLDNGNGRGKGGIKSKLSAIENALDANILSILANGKKENIMLDAFSPKRVGTLFVP